jgi:hypothetical protein
MQALASAESAKAAREFTYRTRKAGEVAAQMIPERLV